MTTVVLPEAPHLDGTTLMSAISAGVRHWLTLNNDLVLRAIHDATVEIVGETLASKQTLNHSLVLGMKGLMREYLRDHGGDVLTALTAEGIAIQGAPRRKTRGPHKAANSG